MPKKIPLEVLFGNPVKKLPKISPDGRKLAYLAPDDKNVMNVWVRTLGQADDKKVTDDKERGIQSFMWAPNGKQVLYVQDIGGNENWNLYQGNIESGESKNLTPFEDVVVQLAGADKHYPNDLLIAMNKDKPQLHDLYHVNLANGEIKKVAENFGNVIDWGIDSSLKVRAAITMTDDGCAQVHLREDDTSPWKEALQWEADDFLSCGFLSFSKDGLSLFLKDPTDYNSGRFVQYDIASGTKTVLAEDKKYGIESVKFNPETYEPQMVSFNREKVEWLVLDESIKEELENLKTLHKGEFSILSRDHADKKWIVSYLIDNGPVSYYLYDREKKEGAFLFENQPKLNEFELASMEPITVQSRDGLDLHGYISFPPNCDRKNLPMVLNVHGGPQVRDGWGFDPEAQWLASCGYICLQINYRGSDGYGKDFLNAGKREWGGKMHDDLIDTVNWAVEKGYADPKRVAIYGGSYGGFAALTGATKTPETFCCAIDYVGPSNLVTFMQTVPEYWKPFIKILHRTVGNPEVDAEFMKSRSPLFYIDNIKKPLFIAQGANDPRIKQSESDQIVEALKKKNIPHTYLLFPDEGHGCRKPENKMKFYNACEAFLAEHMN